MAPKRVNDEESEQGTLEEVPTTENDVDEQVALAEALSEDMVEESESEPEGSEEEEPDVDDTLFEDDVDIERLTEAVQELSLLELTHLEQGWSEKAEEAKEVAKELQARFLLVKSKKDYPKSTSKGGSKSKEQAVQGGKIQGEGDGETRTDAGGGTAQWC